jgi:hypothetical protein
MERNDAEGGRCDAFTCPIGGSVRPSPEKGRMNMRRPFSTLLLFGCTLFLSPLALAQQVHSVWAEKPLYLVDGQTGTQYSSFQVGTATMNWQDKTRYGFFHARATVNAPAGAIRYEFKLIGISQMDPASIEGFWDIFKNGALVCQGCVGKAYGLDLAVGNYFKLYVGSNSQCNDNKWHYSGYITNRIDY